MLMPFRNKKTYSEFVIVGQLKNMLKSRIENLKQSFILVFWKNKLKWFKNLTPIPMVIAALYQNDVQLGDKIILLRW